MVLQQGSTTRTYDSHIQLVIFSSETDRHQRTIAGMASGLLPGRLVHSLDTVDEFVKASGSVFAGRGIYLALIRTKAELEQILVHKERLEDENVILVLPDSDPPMMRKALKLYPRYLSYMKNDYQDIDYVLKKLIGKIENRIKGEYNDSDS